MPARMNFTLGLAPGRAPARRQPGAPMRLLLVGDFSTRPAAERPPLAERRTHRVDVDTLDTVLQQLAPRLELPGGSLDFTSLDDFHPEAMFTRFAPFAALRQARQQAPGGGADLLQGLLGGAAGKPQPVLQKATAPPSATGGIDALIRGIVAPHIVQDTSAQTRQHQATVDSVVAEQMRTLLHDPAFQSLEAAWRGVQWLVSGLDLDEQLQLHLFDVSRDELLADVVTAQGQVTQTSLHQALAGQRGNGPGDKEGWTALAALWSFGPLNTDSGLLAALGKLAAQAGGPLLAAADPALADADGPALAGWQALRQSEAAPWIGLVAPRVLLRLPYGRRSDPVSSFDFEEFVGAPVHDHFLWGNGALAALLLLGRAFTARGWDFEPGDEREIRDLPAYTFVQDGEQALQPCAEHALGEEGGNALLQAGVMPLVSHRNANAVSLLRFQSVAEPASPLAGLSRDT